MSCDPAPRQNDWLPIVLAVIGAGILARARGIDMAGSADAATVLLVVAVPFLFE